MRGEVILFKPKERKGWELGVYNFVCNLGLNRLFSVGSKNIFSPQQPEYASSHTNILEFGLLLRRCLDAFVQWCIRLQIKVHTYTLVAEDRKQGHSAT